MGRDAELFPIVISQDGNDRPMAQLIQSSYVQTGLAFHLNHQHDPDAVKIAKKFGAPTPASIGYVRIAQHFAFAFKRMFDDFSFRQVIVLEEDLEVSTDTFS